MFYPSQEYAPIGSLKARYRPLGLVAQGQFGKVYCAVHRTSGRLVALKLLDRQRSTTSQFLRELTSLLSLSHPALTQLRAIEQTDAGRCLVLDYCAGGTLRQLLESPNLPRRELLLQSLVQVLEGLGHAHGRGIVHCDVKPENILMQLEPQGWRACLTDFGIAQSHAGGDSMEGDPAFERGGSPAYMAPERFSGEAYRASDLYSMGIILYEVLMGDRPFHGSPNALREAHRQAPIKFPQSLDVAFQKLLYRSLSKSPDLRYESANTMALALHQALDAVAPQSCAPDSRSPAAGTSPLFPLFVPAPVLPWPELSAVKQWSWPLESQTVHQVSFAGNWPVAAEHGPIATPHAKPVLSSLGNELPKPQLWFSQGRNLRGTALEGLGSDAVQQHPCPSLTLPEPLIDLALSSRYGFALTDQALYRWPLAVGAAHPSLPVVSACSGAQNQAEHPAFHCLLAQQTNLCQVALSPRSHWAAITQRCSIPMDAASAGSRPVEDRLLLISLSAKAPGHLAPQAEVRELKLRQAEILSGVQILDRRHGAALITSMDEPQRLGLFSRRGQWLSYFTLPVSFDIWVRGIPAYELWALEAGHPQVLLQVGLKPFRIQRIPLAIAPDQIHPLPWGCVLANQAGEILLLNREGQSLGQLQVPLLPDCQQLWLVAVASDSLMIAMKNRETLTVLPLDLRQLELMLVF